MPSKKVVTKRAFMCRTDFEYQVEGDAWGTTLYPSLKTLKLQRRCIDECGWVEVEIKEVKGAPEKRIKPVNPGFHS